MAYVLGGHIPGLLPVMPVVPMTPRSRGVHTLLAAIVLRMAPVHLDEEYPFASGLARAAFDAVLPVFDRPPFLLSNRVHDDEADVASNFTPLSSSATETRLFERVWGVKANKEQKLLHGTERMPTDPAAIPAARVWRVTTPGDDGTADDDIADVRPWGANTIFR